MKAQAIHYKMTTQKLGKTASISKPKVIKQTLGDANGTHKVTIIHSVPYEA